MRVRERERKREREKEKYCVSMQTGKVRLSPIRRKFTGPREMEGSEKKKGWRET